MKSNNLSIGVALLAISYPFLDFFSVNKSNIEPLQIQILLSIFLLLILSIFIFSAILSHFTKIKIYKNIYSFCFLFMFLFFYKDFQNSLNYLIKPNFPNFNFGGEISLILILILFSWTLLSVMLEKGKLYLRFLNIFVILLILVSFFKVLPFNFKFNEKEISSFSDETFFSSEQTKKILKNKNKNIYFVVFDAAIPFENFNDNFKSINYKEQINFFESKKYVYLSDVKSSYDGTHLTLSQMINLSYHINEKTGQYKLSDTYAEIMRRFESSPLGKTLAEIKYDFYWIGNASQNCYLYNYDLCIENYTKKKYLNFNMIFNYFSKILNNYTISIFLERTPAIDMINKVFFINYKKFTSKEVAFKENDGALKFLESKIFSEKNVEGSKNKFILIHALMPHGYAAFNKEPNIYGKNCEILSFKNYKKSISNQLDKRNILINDISGVLIGYNSNYQCFMKRMKQIVNFIEINDPESVVVITSDHGIDFKDMGNNIFFAGKFGDNCGSYVKNKIMDQINGIRLTLSCATNQKVNLLEKKTFKRKMINGKSSRILEKM